MAYLKLRNNTWFAVWRDGGKKVVRSTKVKAKGKKEERLAQATADAMEAAAKGTDSLSRALAAVRAAANALGKGRVIPSVEGFLADFQPGGREHNARNARRAFGLFVAFLGADGALPIDRVSAGQCREFCLAQLKEVSFATVKQYVSQLKAAFNVAMLDDLVPKNPWMAFSLASLVPQGVRRATKRLPFSAAEFRVLLEGLPVMWRDVVLVSFLTGGQRLGDVVCLRWEAVCADVGVVRFATGKTGRVIEAPIVPVLREVLERRWAAADADGVFVFPTMAARYVRSRGKLSVEFTSMLRALGLLEVQECDMSGRRRSVSQRSFHSIRHTVVTLFRESNVVSADMAREIIGHSSEAVERAYFTPSLESKRRGLGLLEETIGSTKYEVGSTK